MTAAALLSKDAKTYKRANNISEKKILSQVKLDGVGPVDNRPSPTVRLGKGIDSKGKQPCKHTASETHTHSQSFKKKKGA